jgi:hypothetical protein
MLNVDFEERHMTALSSPVVKIVGANGQISLGKRYAGRQVLMEEREPGVWLLRTATVVPDNERGLHTAETAAHLREALAWAEAHPADDTDADAVLERLRDGPA